MSYKFIMKIFLSSFIVFLFNCNTNKSETQPKDRKPFLFYFNENDTLSFKKPAGLASLKDSSIRYLNIPYYHKGNVSIGDVAKDISKNGIMYSFGSKHFIQSKTNQKHTRLYLPKDSFKNYQIVKVPWKGKNLKILDHSNPDSAFIVTVDFMNIVQ